MSNIIRKQVTERMSKVVVHNNTVYLCGQVGKPNTSIKDQAIEMLSRVDNLLEEAGSSRKHLLSVTVYLSDMKYFSEFNEIWDAWIIPDHPPARACVEACLASSRLLCEISVMAALI